MMKKFFYFLLLTTLTLFSACDDDNDEIQGGENGGGDYTTYVVTIQLLNSENKPLDSFEGIKVRLYDTKETVYDAVANAKGEASFKVPAGVYRATASYKKKGVNDFSTLYDWSVSSIEVTNQWNESSLVELKLTESKAGNLIIKELYVGGCPKNDGSGNYHMDKYVILYNNSDEQVELKDLCLGMVQPYNAHATNRDYVGGKLIYEEEDWIPAGTGIWFYPEALVVEARKEVVIALNNAIVNTNTYSNSVDFNSPDYYCTYDITAYNHHLYYSAPDASIPKNHYWSAVHYGKGSAWSLSNSSPAFFIFQTQGISPRDFATLEEHTNYYGGNPTSTNTRKKIPTEWILDGIEVFSTSSDKNQKRLTSKVDAGQTYLTNKLGYSSYRNVDKEATEAIQANEGKLVYNYDKGTPIDNKINTDPSGIDAEASIKNGAVIVYQDTNNSTNDFHQRNEASLRSRNQ